MLATSNGKVLCMLVHGLIASSIIAIATLFTLNLETLRTESTDIDDQIGWQMAEIYALSQQISQAYH